MKMNDRISTRDLAELLTGQIGLDKKRSEGFLDALSAYISDGIERNKVVRIMGLGTFKVVLVRERESVHIQTGERFVIPAHHKLSFVPDRDLKEHINRPFAFFDPLETTEIHVPKKVSIKRDNIISTDKIVNNHDEVSNPTAALAGRDFVNKGDGIVKDYFDYEENVEVSEEGPGINEEVEYNMVEEIPKTIDATDEGNYDESVYRELQEISFNSENPEAIDDDYLEKEESPVENVDEMPMQDYVESPLKEEDVDESYYVQTVSIADDEDFEEEGLFTEDENTEQILEDNVSVKEITNNSKTEKRIFAPLWLWIVFGSLLVFFGIGTGMFAFLYYNSGTNKTTEQIYSATDQVSKKESGSPMPIGGFSLPDDGNVGVGDISDDFSSQNIIGDSIVSEEYSNVTDTAISDKKDEKRVIDWLAPSPESTKTETKRAEKPNEKIESKNRELARNTDTKTSRNTGNTTTKTTGSETKTTPAENKEKVIPARVRMVAGSSLTQIAMEYYGDKTFWVYIYEHNKSRIKDFNNIPVGTELRLPLPSAYGINAKSKASVDKAKQKQAQLLNWDDYNL